ncbi:23S rRNA (cytosine1962-C5)-methyltransferase [Niabella drilacis]|uniref:23S rRNA (Cytosine1962-C5)-methyltransferase n=2 Tax=Niabella drilacis (strain DSM 25811 / CCM 8410 / CCUG 62505 / LMG 26954 / E90) TaxID=1285928 RepID=A0A1G6U558_NIADE|nr:23S rRNA (cytosine1962-C5)-methyltransferase [Niabella drilacis]
MFHNRLTKVYRHRSKQAQKQGISCYRIYDHDLPEFPVCIELYEAHIYIAEYKRNHGMDETLHGQWIKQTIEVIAAVTGIAPEKAHVKLRQRKAGRQGQYQKTDITQHEIIVQEHGLKFIVNLEDYLDTGLFLDHRITRKMVMEESAGKRVLNLFAYTGSFSVYAAAGRAAAITTVDLSHTYTQWAERNMQLNALEQPGYSFVQADVLQYIKEVPANTYDLIVMDPPTFSNSKRMDDILDIQRDHVSLVNDCLRILSPGGILYFSTNARKFMLDRDRLQTGHIKDITRATTPFDFEGKLFRWCYKLEK